MIDKLKPGMTKEQVLYVMGHPLARNSFDQSRWDYVHTISFERKKPFRKVLSLYFQEDSLVRFEGFLRHSEGNVPPAYAAIDQEPEVSDN